jgi:hypothetical protein
MRHWVRQCLVALLWVSVPVSAGATPVSVSRARHGLRVLRVELRLSTRIARETKIANAKSACRRRLECIVHHAAALTLHGMHAVILPTPLSRVCLAK